MKKLTFLALATSLMLTAYPVQSNATTTTKTPTSMVVPNKVESLEAKALLLRLDEIKGMDKSNMKPSEKKALRKEVRSIKQELNTMGSGVYISVGAIIIIALLLILLL